MCAIKGSCLWRKVGTTRKIALNGIDIKCSGMSDMAEKTMKNKTEK